MSQSDDSVVLTPGRLFFSGGAPATVVITTGHHPPATRSVDIMARNHRRKTVLATLALIAATALLTACQGTSETTGTGSSTGTSAGAGTDTSAKPADATSPPEAATDAPAEDTAAPADNAKATDGGTDTSVPSNGKGEGVTGTWFGNVSYLAPGKYTVSDMKGVEQAFWLAEDTDIEGTGDICGTDDPNNQAATPCTEAELEAAAKSGVSAEVTLKDGIAVRIVDDH
ncbi:hypothetical protein [Streptomyces sp. NPDC059743]|uniref:hypothetical protein n=1 Tax=Streptomyces sp. NPDC059743 TaxID=3346928 RepID=UPI003655672C